MTTDGLVVEIKNKSLFLAKLLQKGKKTSDFYRG